MEEGGRGADRSEKEFSVGFRVGEGVFNEISDKSFGNWDRSKLRSPGNSTLMCLLKAT